MVVENALILSYVTGTYVPNFSLHSLCSTSYSIYTARYSTAFQGLDNSTIARLRSAHLEEFIGAFSDGTVNRISTRTSHFVSGSGSGSFDEQRSFEGSMMALHVGPC